MYFYAYWTVDLYDQELGLLKPSHLCKKVSLRGNLGNIFARPIVLHVAIHKLSGRQSRHQRELSSKNRTGYDGRQQPCV